jgi:hypothetical protein
MQGKLCSTDEGKRHRKKQAMCDVVLGQSKNDGWDEFLEEGLKQDVLFLCLIDEILTHHAHVHPVVLTMMISTRGTIHKVASHKVNKK